MIGYIYALWGETEKDIFYIGSTVNVKARISEHSFWNRFRKEDETLPNLNYSIIEEANYEDKNDLLLSEIYWIEQFRQWGFSLKNQTLYETFNYLHKKHLPKYGKSLERYLKKIKRVS